MVSLKAVPIGISNLTIAFGSSSAIYDWTAARNGCGEWDSLTKQFQATSTNTTFRITGAKGDVAIDNIVIKGNLSIFTMADKNKRAALLILHVLDMENAPMLNWIQIILLTVTVMLGTLVASARHLIMILRI